MIRPTLRWSPHPRWSFEIFRSSALSSLSACSLFIIAGCSSIAIQAAYANAVALKVDTLALMESATNSYSSQRKEIATLERQMQKTYEYDRGRPVNEKTMQMWDVLLKTDPAHPENGIWPRFLERWRESYRLSAAYIRDKSENVASAFDKFVDGAIDILFKAAGLAF
jgi:hypothetical protein